MTLKTTGERVIEDSYLSSPGRYLIYLFHRLTYQFALPHVAGKTVLDYGCGSGYGTHFLAGHCQQITGVDISEEAVAYASSRYQAENLVYRTIAPAEQAPLPFADDSFATVLSFQVIEHIRHVDAYLDEIRRVLQPGGVFICATPDRSTRLLPGQKPWNVWHVREYARDDFRRLLETRFGCVEVSGMGGRREVLAIELRRARRTMWLTLPVTLPFMPQALRIRALHLLKKLNRDGSSGVASTNGAAPRYDFDEHDLFIAADAKPSTNLVAVARD